MEEEEHTKEVKKYPVLYYTRHKDNMKKEANCLASKKFHEHKIVFTFYVDLFQFFVAFFFENKSLKSYFIFFNLLIVIHDFLTL